MTTSRTIRTTAAVAGATLALLLLLAAPASANKPLPAGVTVDLASPRVCVWTDPGDDIGTVTCVDPTNPECLVYTVYETIGGPIFICHVPAP